MGGEWPVPHLDWLESQGISVLVNLTERPYLDGRFQIHRIPLADGAAPELAQIRRFCDLVDRALEAEAQSVRALRRGLWTHGNDDGVLPRLPSSDGSDDRAAARA